ncbi:hypothetical protein CDL15_Pgr015905 [Punica granatum]|uniref:Uncharacterized protein n=1 Tax=Punica granatum TaxID=22663 RepID=A0A218XQC6_PUNGR|nr:hypothetical protein CDL15_Pgr015905 [Punica granatum]
MNTEETGQSKKAGKRADLKRERKELSRTQQDRFLGKDDNFNSSKSRDYAAELGRAQESHLRFSATKRRRRVEALKPWKKCGG